VRRLPTTPLLVTPCLRTPVGLEVTAYSESNRPTATFAATNANPSVVTNTASKAVFTINGTTTVGGAFLTSNNTKSGTTGTLFSAADFSMPLATVLGCVG
jgi:hypothetical protein